MSSAVGSEILQVAQHNRQEWAVMGQRIVEEMKAEMSLQEETI